MIRINTLFSYRSSRFCGC